MAVTTPPVAALEFLNRRFRSAGIRFALGGSGLLASLGLATQVRDWDITTDAPWEKIAGLIGDLKYERVTPDGIFATAYLCRIDLMGASVDVMGDFALRGPAGVYAVPTRVTGQWNGFPVGCPDAWEKAYALMGRSEKAELLRKRREQSAALLEIESGGDATGRS